MTKPKIDPIAKHIPKNAIGFSAHKNKRNGFAVIELDFTADPAKRSPEWITAERSKMPPRQWAVEMERSWETYAGKAVYDKAFFKHLHVLATPYEANPNYPIFRGWDFGGNQSCVITQIVGNKLYVLDELANRGMNTQFFAPEVIAYCNTHYGNQIYVDVIDPNGMWDTQRARSNSSNADVMREFDLVPIGAPTNDPQKRVNAVIKLLMRLGDDGRPSIQINPHCSYLIKGFEGGYHYPERPSQRQKADLPVKNLFSHIHDALQYVALRMEAHSKKGDEAIEYENSITTPRYKFS